MGSIDFNGICLCKMQASLFENYSDFCHYSPHIFVMRFMNSKLAERFDDMFILGEVSSNETFVEEINEQYGQSSFGNPHSISPEVLYWTGYIYRYWCYKYNISSKLLIQAVHPKMLFNRYFIFHSMDPDYAINRIIEEEGICFPIKKALEELLEENLKEAIKGYQDK